jgi:hypothetical protein
MSATSESTVAGDPARPAGSLLRMAARALIAILLVSLSISSAVLAWIVAHDPAPAPPEAEKHLARLGAATFDFHGSKETFPAGITRDTDGTPLHGWEVQLLPYLGQPGFAAQFKRAEPWNSPANLPLIHVAFPLFLDPAIHDRIDADNLPVSHFGANSNIFLSNEAYEFGFMEDEKSHTILLGTMVGDFRGWGTPFNLRDPAKGWNAGPASFGSPRADGGLVLMADGSVRRLGPRVDAKVFAALGTPEGGEKVELPR